MITKFTVKEWKKKFYRYSLRSFRDTVSFIASRK